MLRLDHIVVTCADLAEGTAWTEAALGVPLAPGGRHDLMSTHNRLLSLGPDCYLEVIAPEPGPGPGRPRWFALDELDGRAAPGLTNWAVRTDDLDATLAAAPEGAGTAVDLARGDLSWRMGVTEDGRTPMEDAFPMLLQWRGEGAFDRLPDAGCRLVSLRIDTPHAAALRLAMPLNDPRVQVHEGPLRLTAEIDAPAGRKVLG